MRIDFNRVFIGFAGALAAVAIAERPARADDPATYTLTLKGDAFTPDALKVAAGKAFVLKLINGEASGVEIEAKDLKIEKIVPAGGEVVAHVKALAPGKYLLVNEYKEETVKTFVVAE